MGYVLRLISLFCLIYIFALDFALAESYPKAEFETIEKGSVVNLEVGDGQDIIEIYDNNTWLEFWDKHYKTSIYPRTRVAPQVDFDNFFVLVALDDIRGGGYSIEIREVILRPRRNDYGIPFKVILELSQPGSAAMTISNTIRPVHIVKIRKQNDI